MTPAMLVWVTPKAEPEKNVGAPIYLATDPWKQKRKYGEEGRKGGKKTIYAKELAALSSGAQFQLDLQRSVHNTS